VNPHKTFFLTMILFVLIILVLAGLKPLI